MKSLFAALPVLILAASTSRADCTYPKAPGPAPDGATATKEQMIAAKQGYDHYNADMNKYLDCIKLEIDAAAAPSDMSKLTPEQKKKVDDQQKVLVQKNNAAVEELQANVARFNEQLKAYKAAHK